MNIKDKIIYEHMVRIEFSKFNKDRFISICDEAVMSQGNPDVSLIDMSLMVNWSDRDIYSYFKKQIAFEIIDEDYLINIRYRVLSEIICEKLNVDDYRGIRNITFAFMMDYRPNINKEIENSIYIIDHYIDDGCLENGYVTVDEVKSEIGKLQILLNLTYEKNSAQQGDAPETGSSE